MPPSAKLSETKSAGDAAAAGNLAPVKDMRTRALAKAPPALVVNNDKPGGGGGGSGGGNGGGGAAEPAEPFNPEAYGENARRLLEAKFQEDGYSTLLIDDDEWYEWTAEHGWRVFSQGGVNAAVRRFFDGRTMIGRGGKPCDFHVNTNFVSNMYSAIKEGALYSSERLEPPCWRPAPDADQAAHQRTYGRPDRLIPCANGIVDFTDMTLHPPNPGLFCHNASPVPFDVAADCPRWVEFNHIIFSGDEQSVMTAQEWFGYCLSDITQLQKIFWIIGPSRSGKSLWNRVLGAAIGANGVRGGSMLTLSQNFGLQSFIGKKLIVFGDVRVPEKADRKVILERVLSISGEDTQTIERKFKEAWSGKLTCRLSFSSNELPEFGDSANAFEKRVILLQTRESFAGREDETLYLSLLAEMPGIFRWGLLGLQRLMARGHFVQPDAAASALRSLRDLSSPMSAFLADLCEFNPTFSVATNDLYDARKLWDREQGAKREISQPIFGKQLRAAAPSVRFGQPRDGEGARSRVYIGVRLNAEGQGLLGRARHEDGAQTEFPQYD